METAPLIKGWILKGLVILFIHGGLTVTACKLKPGRRGRGKGQPAYFLYKSNTN